jgi:hypothetical protein
LFDNVELLTGGKLKPDHLERAKVWSVGPLKSKDLKGESKLIYIQGGGEAYV